MDSQTGRELVDSLRILADDIETDAFTGRIPYILPTTSTPQPTRTSSGNGIIEGKAYASTPTARTWGQGGNAMLMPSPLDDNRQTSFIFDKYEADLRHVPRDTFVSTLIQLTECNEEEINLVREDLYERCKRSRDDTPPGTIVKRLKPRSVNSDTLDVKLARDCHTLYMFLNGAPVVELGVE